MKKTLLTLLTAILLALSASACQPPPGVGPLLPPPSSGPGSETTYTQDLGDEVVTFTKRCPRGITITVENESGLLDRKFATFQEQSKWRYVKPGESITVRYSSSTMNDPWIYLKEPGGSYDRKVTQGFKAC